MLCMVSSCTEKDFDVLSGKPAENTIRVGGIETDELVTSVSTRAGKGVDAETVTWLRQPLKNGLDITYGLYGVTPQESQQDVAVLKLSDTDGEGGEDYDTENELAVYTFKYRADRSSVVGVGNDAIWYNNGFHYFQGVHVPERLRYTTDISEVETSAPNLMTEQFNDTDTGTDDQLGNYTLLSHYLGMPANYRLTATVERIKLPFRHRLARVVAFVLIDPELHTTLKGYKKDASGNAVTDEDPNTTKFRFCNVKVLQGVHDVVGDNGHHELTPMWGKARKVVPHYDGEMGSYSYKTLESFDADFKYYYKDDDGKITGLFPTSASWKGVHDATPDSKRLHNGYTEINYGKVPVYDIIVRPTYTREDSVMYDELDYATQKATLANQINSIDFEIELENGLQYEKKFEFDLNANYQTVVYLRISREHVDYNDAGSDLWIEEKSTDGWYGVDNQNGNTLSFAGSSWQRAYTYIEDFEEWPGTSSGVTDGHFYNSSTSDDEREKAQYFTADYKHIWIGKFLQAYKGGEHHGDYFVLRDNITIDANIIPEDFVFTGHLDAQDKTITLDGGAQWVVCTDRVLAKLKHKTGDEGGDGDYTDVPQLYWMEEIAQAPPRTRSTIGFGDPVLIDMDASLPAVLNTLDTEGKVILYKEGEEYRVYTNRTFYKKTPGYLFAGLNGIYTTAQEADPSIKVWEANVHRETNQSTVWVPTLGYRAEVLNTVIGGGGTLFPADATYSGAEATVTGNVQNCYNGSTAIPNHTPAIPQYK